MALADVTTAEILRAIEEFDQLGRERFLQEYGFGRARRYLLAYESKFYDSKAIVGAAHGYLSGQESLTPKEFSGGESHVVKLLRGLGFVVVDDAQRAL